MSLEMTPRSQRDGHTFRKHTVHVHTTQSGSVCSIHDCMSCARCTIHVRGLVDNALDTKREEGTEHT